MDGNKILTPDAFKEWIKTEIEINHEGKEIKIPRGDRLSYLIKSNGGFVVRGWGVIDVDPSVPWQRGLNQNEAFELMGYENLFRGGVLFGMFNPFDEFKEYFNAYVERIEKEFNDKSKTEEV